VTADVVVVGAGVIGAATAFHLSLLGAGDVLVLDRATAGSGMSCRSSALVRMHYTFGPEVELAVRSDAMFAAWPDLVGRPGCVRRTGFVRIVAAGFSGMGFKIAPAVGEGIAGLIAGAPDGSVDLAPFRPGRLREGRPIEAPNPYSDD
jgi:glycine/D-amino acid oxidase-like deaminating enzyme